MHRCARLKTLRATGQKGFDRIYRRSTDLRANRQNYPERRIQVESAALVIELLNTWSNFSRAYMISCCMGARTESGVKVASQIGFTSEDAAIGHMLTRFKRTASSTPSGAWNRRDEPAWHSPDKLIILASHARLSNEQEINNSLSSGFTVFTDLPKIRNYFAHRNRETRTIAMSLAPKYGVSALGKPSELVLHAPSGQTDTVLETWTTDIRTTMVNLCY